MKERDDMTWNDKTVLITGGTGSFGRKLTSLLLAEYQPKKIIIFSRDEMKQFTMRAEGFDAGNIRYFIGDVRDKERLYRAFYEVDVVVHAAAIKQVPLLQTNAREAIRNNIFGLTGLLDAAERNGCESFVFISSDKAVNSANIMGATKRVGELILSSRPSNAMRCISVRFGNVLGSNGSVVPIFNGQIRSGHELTITHPDVCRFFMTIHEAVSLVLQAFTIGSHGEILVLDMGQPVRILDLAKTLIRLSGKSAEDVRIRFTGLRPGEKLCEELFHPNELVTPTRYPKIRTARGPRNSWAALEVQLKKLWQCVATGDDAALRSTLQSIVSTASQQDSFFPSALCKEESEPELLRRVAGA
jgi:FlaA1/EpsC-like NDP-sugar epimerase